MPSVERSIGIRRPVDQVFRFLRDGRTGTQWRPGSLEITALEADTAVEFRTLAGSFDAAGAFELEPMGDATILSMRLEVELTGWRRLVRRGAVRAALAAELAALDALRDVLER